MTNAGEIMAYDTALAARVRDVLIRTKSVSEKKMFGGICFLLNGRILVGVWKQFLVARLGPDQGEMALREAYVTPFNITGKPMKGWVMIEPIGVEDEDQVQDWVQRATTFVRTLPHK